MRMMPLKWKGTLRAVLGDASCEIVWEHISGVFADGGSRWRAGLWFSVGLIINFGERKARPPCLSSRAG